MNSPNKSYLSKQLATRIQAKAPEEQSGVLLDFLGQRGQRFYYEEVTQLEHALQCAALAEEENAGHHLITGALLHDIGHLLVDQANDPEEAIDTDFCHEQTGADFLALFFPATVTDPIRLHVPAKRYLCTVDHRYWQNLSGASRESLVVQGGKMSAQEKAHFETTPALDDALRLRTWDDIAKTPGRKTPELQHYSGIVTRCLTSH